MKKLLQNNWIKSITCNVVVLVFVMLITSLVYETNDDFAISSRIVAGYPYVGFINYFMCKILIPIQEIFVDINVFVLVQILTSFVAFVFILKILFDSSKTRITSVITVIAILLFSFNHYCMIQFTKTAVILLLTGMLIMIDSMINKRKVIYYIYSIAFLFLGVSFRPDSLLCVIGFAGLYLIVWVITNRKRLIPEGYLTAKRIILYIVLLSLIGCSYGFYQLSEKINNGTADLKTYSNYSQLRSDVVDYPVYENYEQNKREYQKIGISENDLFLLDRWYFDYDGAASVENLKAIISIDSQSQREPYTLNDAYHEFIKETYKDVSRISLTGIYIILLGVLSLWMAVTLKPRHWIYIGLIAVFTICVYMAIYYMQRPVYRALYVADVCAGIWLLYYMNYNYERNARGKVTGIMVAIIALLLIIPTHGQYVEKEKTIESKVMSIQMKEYLDKNIDKYYVVYAFEKRIPIQYLRPLESPGLDSEKNIIGAGSWGTMSPYVLEKMAGYGIVNPIKDLIDNEKAYYVGNVNIDRLTEYYNKWYRGSQGEIIMNKVDNISGYAVWKVEHMD